MTLREDWPPRHGDPNSLKLFQRQMSRVFRSFAIGYGKAKRDEPDAFHDARFPDIPVRVLLI